MPRGVRNPKPEDVNNEGADLDVAVNSQEVDPTSNSAETGSNPQYHLDFIRVYERPDLRTTSWCIYCHYRETGERRGKFIEIVYIAPGFRCQSGWMYRP